MEAPQTIPRHFQALHQALEDPRLTKVFKKAGLPCEAKYAWLTILKLAGFRVPAKIWVHVGAIGEAQGTSDASGRRSLNRLAEHGLIGLLDREHGRWFIELYDPLEEVHARRPTADDQQPVMFDAPTPQPPPSSGLDQPQTVPFAPRSNVSAPTDGGSATDPPSQGTGRDIPSAQIVGVKERDPPNPYDGGSVADPPRPASEARLTALDALRDIRDRSQRYASPESGPTLLGDIMPDMVEEAAMRSIVEEQQASRIADEIFRTVDEPTFPRWICQELGFFIAKGQFSVGRLRAKFANLATKRKEWSEAKHKGNDKEGDTGMRRRNYFTSAIKGALDDVGLRLFDSTKSPTPNSRPTDGEITF